MGIGIKIRMSSSVQVCVKLPVAQEGAGLHLEEPTIFKTSKEYRKIVNSRLSL